MNKYLSEEDYLNSFKWCETDSVVDISAGGIASNDFIGQDMVDAVVDYAHNQPQTKSVSDAAEEFKDWFERQPFGSEYSLDEEGAGSSGPIIMSRDNVIYITSKNGEYDHKYGVFTSDTDILVCDLNTNKVLSCERQIEHARGFVVEENKVTML